MTGRETGNRLAGNGAMLSFVVQAHEGARLHYDLRLEVKGRWVSWAVPKGPSLDPRAHRFAFRTPDHALDMGPLEGTLRSAEGRGESLVLVWDEGTYQPLLPAGVSLEGALQRGVLKLRLEGQRLRGLWKLVHWKRTPPSPECWVLTKLPDRHVVAGHEAGSEMRSVRTGRSFEEMASALGSPPGPTPGTLEAYGET